MVNTKQEIGNDLEITGRKSPNIRQYSQLFTSRTAAWPAIGWPASF